MKHRFREPFASFIPELSMKRLSAYLALTTLPIVTLFFQATTDERSQMMAADAQEPLLVHNVYFALNDNSPANVQKLLADCKKYLTDHPGTVFFAAGTVSDLDRSVNDRDFDVGLHVI